MQIVGIEVFSLPRGGIFFKVSQASYMSHFHVHSLVHFLTSMHVTNRNFGISDILGLHRPQTLIKPDGEVGGGDHTLVSNRSSIPGARPSLPDAGPPSASMVGNLNVGYRGRLFTSPGITQALYISSRMHLHHGTLGEVLIFCRNCSL